mgnify:CR=1 FL=1
MIGSSDGLNCKSATEGKAKAQKHLAQGNALGLLLTLFYPGCCPGLGAFALSGRILVYM